MSKLINTSKTAYGEQYDYHLLEQWKTCVEMANCNSDRRINTNNVFLSLNVAIIALMSSLISLSVIVLAFTGIVACVLWILLLNNFRVLNGTKFEVINEIEKFLPTSPFDYEWIKLKNDKEYKLFSKIETCIPCLFISVYIIGILWWFFLR